MTYPAHCLAALDRGDKEFIPLSRSQICHALASLFVLTAPAAAQVTKLVSLSSAGVQGDSESASPAISVRGRYVVLHSEATNSADGRSVGFYSFGRNLVPADSNGVPDVFVR